jgi:hypothetical protein
VCNLVADNTGDGDFFDNIDAGYREWGIVPEATVPYQAMQVGNVALDVLATGKRWARFEADFVKAWDAANGASQSQLDRAVAYLDEDTPVAVGGWWPRAGQWSTTETAGVEVMSVPAIADKETVLMDGHSVALVGYRRDSTFAGGGYFVFRNSWGGGWGDSGYGYMPFEYVRRFANDLVAYRTRRITSGRLGIQAVAGRKDGLDVVATNSQGIVHFASWQQDMHRGRWRGWWPLLDGASVTGAPVAAVARDVNKLDVFVAGKDGKTYTAAWDRKIADGQWRGWWNILTGAIPPGGTVTAVSRHPNKLDIFLVSTDGGVYTAAWDQNVADGNWRGWWRIGTLTATPGAPVAAVARDTNKLDVFVAGTDGKTYTAAWDQNVADGQWRGWWNILTGAIPPRGNLTSVSRDPNKLDIFLLSTDAGVYTAAWDQHVADGKWRGWWRIGTLTAKPGAPVAAVARDANKLDVFVAGTDGKTYTAAWDQNVADGQWRGWWNILTGAIPPGGTVTAVSRDANKLDIFLVSTDGGVYTAAWDQHVSDGKWRGWWRIGP